MGLAFTRVFSHILCSSRSGEFWGAGRYLTEALLLLQSHSIRRVFRLVRYIWTGVACAAQWRHVFAGSSRSFNRRWADSQLQCVLPLGHGGGVLRESVRLRDSLVPRVS